MTGKCIFSVIDGNRRQFASFLRFRFVIFLFRFGCFRGLALVAWVWLCRGWADGWLWLLGVDFFGVGLMGGFG